IGSTRTILSPSMTYLYFVTDATLAVAGMSINVMLAGKAWPTATLNPAGTATVAGFCAVTQVLKVVVSVGDSVNVVVVLAAANAFATVRKAPTKMAMPEIFIGILLWDRSPTAFNSL